MKTKIVKITATFKHITYVEVPEDVPAHYVNTLPSVYDEATAPYDATLDEVETDDVTDLKPLDPRRMKAEVPSEEEIDELMEWLEANDEKEVPHGC